MNEFVCLHDKGIIEEVLRRDTDLHVYEIGDLDNFFWPHTLWFARPEPAPIASGSGLPASSPTSAVLGADRLSALALLYVGQSPPTFLALGRPEPLRELVRAIAGLLPPWFYAHLSPGVEQALEEKFLLEPHGTHFKMSLKDHETVRASPHEGSVRLGPEHLTEVLQLYAESYPGNWFEPRLLETREYVGLRDGGRLVCIAGTHVFSPAYRVAALGNITTLPSHRHRGLATRATRDLCRSLLEKVDHIGLNVAADNRHAIACYRRLGFEIVATYGEFSVHARP
ncbi:MAG: Acetyltransferase [Candidatus Ozemobacter sibiricus]|jgi:ribosomal protein S18 acetylase RimI-like enzyme|uniref:Acetyltransferase n=1 Tax=Candidatus Ozemobacter sibiricus TaxID=2268124 RepID=A0A367ZL71_9BACT|nr:MAG: Acetyltransferase [Candidatus Ozemobacter sibiricus]